MTEEKKRKDPDQPLFDWEEELKAMAEDVPEMPESFREGWRSAIRLEAEKVKSEIPAEADRETQADAKIIRVRKWTAILSTAAVVVFLLGGTLLTRESGLREQSVMNVPAVMYGSDNAVPGPEMSAAREEPVSDAAPVMAMGKAAREEPAEAETAEESAVTAMSETNDETPVPVVFAASRKAVPDKAAGKNSETETAEGSEKPGFPAEVWAFARRSWPWILGFSVAVGVGLSLWTNKARKTGSKKW